MSEGEIITISELEGMLDQGSKLVTASVGAPFCEKLEWLFPDGCRKGVHESVVNVFLRVDSEGGNSVEQFLVQCKNLCIRTVRTEGINIELGVVCDEGVLFGYAARKFRTDSDWQFLLGRQAFLSDEEFEGLLDGCSVFSGSPVGEIETVVRAYDLEMALYGERLEFAA